MALHLVVLIVPAFFLLLLAAAHEPHGSEAGKEMGPVAFMWPPDREWGAAQDNTPPCGSAASAGNRTDFPLSSLLLLRSFPWLSHQPLTM